MHRSVCYKIDAVWFEHAQGLTHMPCVINFCAKIMLLNSFDSYVLRFRVWHFDTQEIWVRLFIGLFIGEPSAIGCRFSVIGHRNSVVGHRSSVIGRRSSVVGHRNSAIGHRMSVIGCRLSVIGHRKSDFEHRSSDFGRRSSVILPGKVSPEFLMEFLMGHRTSVIGRRPVKRSHPNYYLLILGPCEGRLIRSSVIGHRTSVIGYRSSDIGCRFSVIGHRSSVIECRSSVIGHSPTRLSCGHSAVSTNPQRAFMAPFGQSHNASHLPGTRSKST